ncbi:MAG: replication-associated recombination protein A [Gammaproteobacteria bacterium]|nr:replication-associated recombination protein A [Gammaproteobacteria bacterium]
MPDLQYQPLATRMRPQTLDEFFGQEHLLSQGKPLRSAIEHGKLHSMVLWGPPGTGKTTLANLLAASTNAHIERLSAVLSGVKEIRAVVEIAQANRERDIPTIVFVDEVHRFNKSQQDAFLPHIESGIFTFIGATTENPSFELNNALLSRARVYVLKSLDTNAIRKIIDYALQNNERGLGHLALQFPPELRDQVAQFADGDARTALNLIEIIADLAIDTTVTEPILQEALSAGVRRFDKGGDEFYNQISALHKAVRGSAPDAALYWLVRMLDGGCDPLYVARRVVRMASEDIGNADPRALDLALQAWDVLERLGSPEGELTLAQAVIYLAVAPKSNAVYVAYNEARVDVEKYGSLEVPLPIRNASTKLMKSLDYGKDYRYAHDEPDAYAAGENYFPDKMPQRQYYRPVNRGLEIKIAEKMAQLRKLDAKIPSK